MGDVVERLREWDARDMDTHAVLLRRGTAVAEIPYVQHSADLVFALLGAAREIERLRREVAALRTAAEFNGMGVRAG